MRHRQAVMAMLVLVITVGVVQCFSPDNVAFDLSPSTNKRRQHHRHHQQSTVPWLLDRHQRPAPAMAAVTGADIEQDTDETPPQVVGDTIIYRGKVNEIDYCIAPADVSLSRAYGQTTSSTNTVTAIVAATDGKGTTGTAVDNTTPTSMLSLTQALNNASNRAVRRILLAKCWPSEEALNKSLRLAAAAEKQAQANAAAKNKDASGAKCPVPRPLLNLLMRKGSTTESSGGSSSRSGGGTSSSTPPPPPSSSKGTEIGGPYTTGTAPVPTPSTAQLKTRTNEQYVKDQIVAFQERYGMLEGYQYAEAYLESILSLATTGKETSRVKDVLESKVYDESYRRVMSVLKSVGVVLEELPGTDRFQIASKLRDQDFCLSVIDIISIQKGQHQHASPAIPPLEVEEKDDKNDSSTAQVEVGAVARSNETPASTSSPKRNRLQFWKKSPASEVEPDVPEQIKEPATTTGGIVLCADEPSMTRQLNALSNIVHRGLLYGGDQELLVLSETLADNSASFSKRWYPSTGPPAEEMKDETRPGLQYFNALISLLRQSYDEGIVTDLGPLVPLSQSYANSYERLMASLVEMGSGYVRPDVVDVMSMPKPRTAQEELGRFAVWETAFRSNGDESTTYPDDLEGTWEVRDEVSGEVIGTSTVVFQPHGDVLVDPPLQGLRWRLDPGPTHLDTCTFQVLSEDGMILQYRGFIDRGARLEARFSKRPTRIRGSVMFQMRYGGSNYWKDMMPVNYKTGGTKFVMTKKLKDADTLPIWKNI